jgi:hypothetical protein
MESKQKFRPDPHLRLMDQVRQVLRYHHCACRTEKTYCDWADMRNHLEKVKPRGQTPLASHNFSGVGQKHTNYNTVCRWKMH